MEAQNSLAKDPNNRAKQLTITRWMFAHGHVDEGIRWAEKLIRDQPGHAEACRLLADHYARTGKPGLANSYRAQLVEHPVAKP